MAERCLGKMVPVIPISLPGDFRSISRLGRWSRQFPGAFRSKSQFERGFKPDNPASQLFDVVLLLGDGGSELFDFVGQSDRSG